MALLSFCKLDPRKLQKSLCKVLCSTPGSKANSSSADKTAVKQQQVDVKPFHKIPGPLSLPWIGTKFFYLFRVYDAARLHKASYKKYLKYGPIVREEITPGNSTVWIFDANDMERLFLAENHLPQRRSHLGVGVLRKDRPEMYNTGGLLNTNGEDWWKLRREFQKGFSAPQAVRAYLPPTDSMIQEFVSTRLYRSIDDFLPDLSRLFLQLTCLVAFDEKIDCFSPKEMESNSRSSRLMEAALTTNSMVLDLDNTRDVKKSSLWPKFKEVMLYMEDVAVEFVKKKADSMVNLKRSEEIPDVVPSLLELYLTSPNLDYKDVVGMAVDLLLAGIDTTAYTASFLFYHVARNERVQNILRQEAQKLIQSPAHPITSDMLAQAPYARSVLKEVFRLNPISIGVGRVLSQDLVLSGYHIPRGTNVVTQNQVACRLRKYFSQPDEFLPERWLKGSPTQVKDHPYLVLPFGHGPRSCIARRLAEQHLLTLLLRITHSHRICWTSDKVLDCKTLLINKPDKDVTLSFSRL